MPPQGQIQLLKLIEEEMKVRITDERCVSTVEGKRARRVAQQKSVRTAYFGNGLEHFNHRGHRGTRGKTHKEPVLDAARRCRFKVKKEPHHKGHKGHEGRHTDERNEKLPRGLRTL